jgi:hypothetical protein
MPAFSKRYRACLEPLEARELLTALPANTLAVASGTVAAPGGSAQVSTPVTAENIHGKSSIVIGESITAAPGSGIQPQFVAAYGPDGKRLPVEPGAPFVPGAHESATVFITVSTPGPITTVVTGAHGTTGAFQVREYLPGDVNGDGQVTVADLAAFAPHFLSNAGGSLYDPAADANLNGQVAAGDARYIERNMAPLTRRVPTFVTFHLGPGEQVRQHPSTNSGGVTYDKNVTIIGHTIPGALVFSDSADADYTFTGPILPTDARGIFTLNATLTSGINNFDFLIVDQFGRQFIKDFPVFWSAYAARNSRS